MSGAGDLADAAGAGELGHRAQVVGHVRDRGDAAVEVAAQAGLGLAAVGRGGEMLVAVDQAGQQVPAGEVDDPGAGRGPASRSSGSDLLDPLAVHHDRHAGRRAAPVPSIIVALR